jgi:hypothetical protein
VLHRHASVARRGMIRLLLSKPPGIDPRLSSTLIQRARKRNCLTEMKQTRARATLAQVTSKPASEASSALSSSKALRASSNWCELTCSAVGSPSDPASGAAVR